MSSDPIPKTIPRSTLACPPAKNFAEQYKASSTNNLKNSINTNSNNKNDDSRDKIINKNESQKNFGLKKSSTEKDEFVSTGNNFKPDANKQKSKGLSVKPNENGKKSYA